MLVGAQAVVELGAGTGQLTGQLLQRGIAVHAVEADARMIAALRRHAPAAHTYESWAHKIPLPDQSVDAVVSADAWHWFPVQETIAEVGRVLRPGGWLALVWNKVTPVHEWEYELAGIDPDKKGIVQPPAEEQAEGLFPADEVQVASVPWVWRRMAGYLDMKAPLWIHRVPTDDRSVSAVAADVIERSGWAGRA
ncbi:MAG: class I SAM-dependent methyltransferase [Nocardioides sp.]|uniref:class I SAM-dependent methyltransferase n=1 Tax=Nocardioides sp. TaxID=35761 RepID=UPI0039E479B0